MVSTLQRKIIASEFYETVGISEVTFYKFVKIIRKANNIPNSKGKFI